MLLCADPACVIANLPTSLCQDFSGWLFRSANMVVNGSTSNQDSPDDDADILALHCCVVSRCLDEILTRPSPEQKVRIVDVDYNVDMRTFNNFSTADTMPLPLGILLVNS